MATGEGAAAAGGGGGGATKKLSELRVIDLRAELDKRGLDKGGVRAVLVKRLEKFLKDEGKDPETYTFELSASDPKTPSKRSSRTESTVETELTEEQEEALLDGVRVEDMIVQDEAGDDAEEEKKVIKEGDKKPKLEIPVKQEEKPEVKSSTEENGANRKRELKEETEAVDAKKLKNDVETKKKEEGEEIKTENTEENYINLDIGDDELLNDEADNPAKGKKDESGAAGAGDESKTGDGAATGNDTAGNGDSKQDGASAAKSDGNTTSEKADDKKEKDQKDEKKESESGDGKDHKDDSKDGGSGASGQARNLWVSGLSGDTRAKDLKQLCSKHGKVIGAKVVTNAKTPGSRCYGYVTMASSHDAESCIKNLHRTELHGRMISVEKAKSESAAAANASSSSRRSSAPSRRDYRRDERRDNDKSNEAKDESGEVKKEGEENTDDKPKEGEEGKEERATSRTRALSSRSDKPGEKRRERSRERRRSPRGEVLSLSKITKERELARQRERTRQMREEERRRRAAEDALRERERRQRQEKAKLALERERLRAERDRIEREKNELLRLERERHKLEREKLELERLELKRAQMRLEEERRKRPYDSGPGYRKPNSPPPPPPYDRDIARHKRVAPSAMSSGRNAFEAPPPPRFEMTSPAYERQGDKRERDYKRDYPPRHIASSAVKYPSNGTSSEDSRQPVPPGTRVKETGRPGGYEPRYARSSPPGKPESRPWTSTRYPDPPTTNKATPAQFAARSKDYNDRSAGGGSGGSSWTGSSKPYASSRPAAPSAQPWSKPGSSSTAEPWQSSSGGGGSGGGSDSRYSSSNYEQRSYPAAYQPPPPGAAPYVDRYATQQRSDYRQKY